MSAHWRNTMKEPRFLMFDAKSAFPVALLIVHIRWWTLILTIVTMFFFWILERKGLTFSSALRSFRVWLLGKNRPALLWTKKRKMKDTGSV